MLYWRLTSCLEARIRGITGFGFRLANLQLRLLKVLLLLLLGFCGFAHVCR
jgi:hypothetical protein